MTSLEHALSLLPDGWNQYDFDTPITLQELAVLEGAGLVETAARPVASSTTVAHLYYRKTHNDKQGGE